MTGPRQRDVVVVFAKAPRVGLVKTRMTPALSPAEATGLYASLLDDVLATTADVAEHCGLEAIVAVHPADACAELARRAPPRFRIVAQRGRSLAERMGQAAAEATAAGSRRILLRGSDSPLLGLDVHSEALAALLEVDVVFSPDQGGGYGLVGLRCACAGLFDHEMSTTRVLDDTRSCAAALGLSVGTIAPCFDLDTVSDLARLRSACDGESAAGSCPRTLRFLDEHALWDRVPVAAASV